MCCKRVNGRLKGFEIYWQIGLSLHPHIRIQACLWTIPCGQHVAIMRMLPGLMRLPGFII